MEIKTDLRPLTEDCHASEVLGLLTVQSHDPWRCQGEWEGRRFDCRGRGIRWWSAVAQASPPPYAVHRSASESLQTMRDFFKEKFCFDFQFPCLCISGETVIPLLGKGSAALSWLAFSWVGDPYTAYCKWSDKMPSCLSYMILQISVLSVV